MSFEDHPINRLNAAGPPDFVTYQLKPLTDAAIERFEKITGRTLSDSQVEMYHIETQAYMLSVFGTQVQLAIADAFVAWAREHALEAHGEGVNTPRLQATRATTTLLFVANPGAAVRITIPAGTRVGDTTGQIQFRTLNEAVIEPGTDDIEVPAEATETGVYANRLAPGVVRAIIDTVPGIAEARNLTETGSGAAIEPLDRWRVRVTQAFERIGDGLSYERYQADVLGWNPRCIAVSIERPQPGYVNIAPLMDDGLPNAEELASLQSMFDKSNTHQGDFIQVAAPATYEFSFTLDLVLSDPSAEAPAIAAAQSVVDGWARALGGFITPSEIINAVDDVPGVVNAGIADLAFAAVAKNTWPNCTGITMQSQVI